MNFPNSWEKNANKIEIYCNAVEIEYKQVERWRQTEDSSVAFLEYDSNVTVRQREHACLSITAMSKENEVKLNPKKAFCKVWIGQKRVWHTKQNLRA